MCAALSRILVLPEECEDDEELYDICRAYGLLLNVCGSAGPQEHKQCSTKVCVFWTVAVLLEGTVLVYSLDLDRNTAWTDIWSLPVF